MLDVDFPELRKAEVQLRRIILSRTPVNKGERKEGRRETVCDPSYGTATRSRIATTSESNWLPAPLVSSSREFPDGFRW